MKVKVKNTVTTREEVEVEFPIYRKDDYSGDDFDSVIYTCINSDLKAVSICKQYDYRSRDTSFKIEVEPNYFFHRDKQYELGLGEYSSSKEDFDSVAADFYKFMAENII